MDGSIEDRGKMFQYYDVMSDSDEDDDMALDNEEALEQNPEGPMGGDSAQTDSTENSSSSSSPTATASATRIHDAEYRADEAVMYQLSRLRKKSRNLLPFAHWAFGADGIPSLQVLAYGDFSFEDRFGPSHILCRKTFTFPKSREKSTIEGDEEVRTLPFRPIRDSDIEMMELVNENMDFLAACPVDPIVMGSE